MGGNEAPLDVRKVLHIKADKTFCNVRMTAKKAQSEKELSDSLRPTY